MQSCSTMASVPCRSLSRRCPRADRSPRCRGWRCLARTVRSSEPKARWARSRSMRCRCRHGGWSIGIGERIRLSGAPAGLAGRNGARLSVPLFLLFHLATARSRRARAIDRCRGHDFANVGDDIFVADDLFWYHPARSLALATELKRRGIRKKWILVQSRVDLVARHADLLAAWRPIADEFDIFFGLEAATNDGLKGLVKDATVDHTNDGIAVRAIAELRRHRQLRHRPGVAAGGLRAALGVRRAASASFRRASPILTPLPGTATSRRCGRGSARGSGRISTCTTCCGSRRSDPSDSSSCTARRGGGRCSTCAAASRSGSGCAKSKPRERDLPGPRAHRTQRMLDPAHYLAEYDLGPPEESVAAGWRAASA